MPLSSGHPLFLHVTAVTTRRKRKPAGRPKKAPSPKQAIGRLVGIFGEHSEAILRRACDGETPRQIAADLQLSEHEVQQFIDFFLALPKTIVSMLLRSPELLQNGSQLDRLVRSSLRASRRTARR